MPFSWGGAALGASRGMGSILDILQYNQQQKIGADQRAEMQKEKQHAAMLDALMKSISLGQAGGYVEEPGQMPTGPQMSGPVNVDAIGSPQRGPSTQRPVSVQDMLGGPDVLGRIQVDPMRSTAMLAQRAAVERKQAAGRAFTQSPSTETRAAAITNGWTPAELDELVPKPALPKETPDRSMTDYQREQVRIANERLAMDKAKTGAPSVPKPPTAAQRKTEGFLMLAEDANAVLDKLAASGKKVPTLMEKVGAGIGRTTGNYLTSDEYRQMRAAALRLSDQWLRYTSGAAVPESEVERFALSFLPVAGDDEATLADKHHARGLIVDALRKGVGQGGGDDDLETMLQQFLSRKQPPQ